MWLNALLHLSSANDNVYLESPETELSDQCAALIEFLVSAAPRCMMALMFRGLLDTGITGVGTDYVFLVVQKLIDLGSISQVGYRADHAVHQTRLVIQADVRLHAEVILVTLLGLAHFWIALTILVLGRTQRIDQRGIDNRTLAQRQTAVTQIAIDHRQDARGQLVLLKQTTEVEDRGFCFIGKFGGWNPGIVPKSGTLLLRFLNPRRP